MKFADLPSHILDESGLALYSGTSPFKPGPLYIMALNTGGDSKDTNQGYVSLREAIKKTQSNIRIASPKLGIISGPAIIYTKNVAFR